MLDTILEQIKERAGSASALGKTLKFDFGDEGKVFIDGTGDANEVSAEDNDADCTIALSTENMKGLMSGDLNPMMAFMSGKLKVDGDMSIAMKLQKLFA